AGLPRGQYFVGTAYAGGLGVERNLSPAVTWWFRAAEQGVPEAEEALAQLRQAALGRGRRAPAERQAADQAFRDYRVALWTAFPDVARDGDEPLGAALLGQGRVGEAVTALIREASALSEPAERLLETLYEQGVEGRLPPYDERILGYFKSAAAEGQLRARIALARFYTRGSMGWAGACGAHHQPCPRRRRGHRPGRCARAAERALSRRGRERCAAEPGDRAGRRRRVSDRARARAGPGREPGDPAAPILAAALAGGGAVAGGARAGRSAAGARRARRRRG